MKYQPRQKEIVMCNFSGFIVPEITKIRPVVIIKKDRKNQKLVAVVPITSQTPYDDEEYYLKIDSPLKEKKQDPSYIKCNLIYTVSIDRLEPINRKQVIYDKVTDEQFLEIKEKIAKYLTL